MKKHLIAAAVAAAVAVPAMAQDVSLYGIVDAGYSSSKADVLRYVSSSNSYTKDRQTTKGVVGNGVESTSRFGLRGTEDLGGGLKANFVFETGMNPATSTISTWNNRQAFVGLEGGFGRVDVGTLYSPLHGIAAAFNPNTLPNLAGDVMYVIGATSTTLDKVGITAANGALVAGTSTGNAANLALYNADLGLGSAGTVSDITHGIEVNATTTAVGTAVADLVNNLIGAKATADLNARLALANTSSYTVRNNNTIGYVSPAINGFTVAGQITGENSVKVDGRSETKTSGNNLAVRYSGGPLSVAVGLANSKAKTVTPSSSTTAGTSTATITTIAPDGVRTTNIVTGGNLASTTAAKTVEAKNKEVMAAISYDLGMAKLSYIYATRDTKDTISELSEKETHSFGVKAPFGATTVFALYTTGEQKVLPGAGETKFDLDGVQVGASYALSKRTDAYALYGSSKWDNKANGNDIKDTQFALGVRHQF